MNDALHSPLAGHPLGESYNVDRVCDAFEETFRNGHRPRIEDYAGPDAHVLVCELVGVDIQYRRAAGETPTAG